MASTFNIQGPTALHIAQGADNTTPSFGSGTILGYTDNSDLISVEIDNMMDPYESTEGGKEPAAMIYQGTVVTITATLIKWDTANKDKLTNSIWEAEGSTAIPGAIGQNQFDQATFTHVENLHLKIDPTDTDDLETYSYWFKHVWLESMSETSWGNAPKKLVLTLKAKRSSGNVIYVRA
jgi:hypothetical protein